MKLDDNMVNLISTLEYKIGDSCYNPNSYDGYNDEYGCEFRYPVWYTDKNNEDVKVYGHLSQNNINIDEIMNAKYKFGSNHLQVTQAIVQILEELEQRYGIDIYKLEKKYQKDNK